MKFYITTCEIASKGDKTRTKSAKLNIKQKRKAYVY